MTGIESSIVKSRKDGDLENAISVGQRVLLVSGALTGLAGVVVRREKSQIYVIGVPDAESCVLVRVQRQRFRCLKPSGVKDLAADASR
jgi:hypothetical protein